MEIRSRYIAAIVGLASSVATASPFSPYLFDNALPAPIPGLPRVGIIVDDYGGYGTLLGNLDEYAPVSSALSSSVTRFAGAYLNFEERDESGTLRSANIALTENPNWLAMLGGGNGITTDFTTFSRTLTQPNFEFSTNNIQSVIDFDDLATSTHLTVTLNQILLPDPATRTTSLQQEWIFENTSVRNVEFIPMEVVFHIQWDPDIVFDGDSNNDIVGRRAGCYVYVRDAQAPDQAFSLENGTASSDRFAFYFGGKKGFNPNPTINPPTPYNGTDRDVFDNNSGMPLPWNNNIATVTPNGTNGESGSLVGDANMGLEYRLQIIPNGGKKHIFVIRTYGTAIRACPVGTQCGDPTVDPGEECQSGEVDSATCDFTCLFPRCGDGHVNLLAGETCESAGVDTDWCNGAPGGTCTTPICGDGYMNAVTGEQCDEGAQETATCNGSQTGNLTMVTDCRPPICGDHYTNIAAGEQCDTGGFDTGDCNADCTHALCGDGHPNAAAGEACDTAGVDTDTCNAGDCTVSACGDGYVNKAADEECDGGELCDPAVCKFTFHLGGGCGGCSSRNPESPLILGSMLAFLLRRRRRYN